MRRMRRKTGFAEIAAFWVIILLVIGIVVLRATRTTGLTAASPPVVSAVSLQSTASASIPAQVTAHPSPPVSPPEVKPEVAVVRMTVTGAEFFPVVELAAGSKASVLWLVEEGGTSYSGLNPNMKFGSAGTRHVRLTVVDSSGADALRDVATFNIGFASSEDAGKYNVGSAYNHPKQQVSGVEGVRSMTGLVRFLAATPLLKGAVDFSGMSALQYIECFGAKLSSVNLTGCDRLIRLCVENNDLSEIDLNPVSKTLRDLRLSGNRSAVTIAPLTSPMLALYHYCAQSITVTHHPAANELPVIEELWDWKSGQTGALVIRSTAVRSVITYENGWTSADLTGQFPKGRNGHFDAHGCRLSSVTLTGCDGLITLDLHNNQLGQAAVDGILKEAASWGTYGGKLNLAGNASPSAAGLQAAASLKGRGWTVTV